MTVQSRATGEGKNKMQLMNLLYIFKTMENCTEGLQEQTLGKAKGSIRKEM